MLLIPQSGLFEVFVGQHCGVGIAIDAKDQKDVVEGLPQPNIVRFLVLQLHQNFSQCRATASLHLLLLGLRGQTSHQRQCCPTQQLLVIRQGDSGKKDGVAA